MWYAGNDGTTSRILKAERPPGGGWERLGVAIDAGSAGDSDSYGAESPCVVKTPGGYLMVGVRRGDQSPPHSDIGGLRSLGCPGDNHAAQPRGRGRGQPSLSVDDGERWWLFHTGYPGSGPGQRSVLVAAVSQTGASWDRVGAILEPEAARWRCRTPARSRSPGRSTRLHERCRWSGPHRDGELIRRPVVGSPGHGLRTRGPGARRFERPHALRGGAAQRVRWYVVRGHFDRRRRARLPDLFRTVPGPWST